MECNWYHDVSKAWLNHLIDFGHCRSSFLSFKRRRAENDRSQATLVTGKVKGIVNMVCIAGKRDAFEFARASVAVIGFKRK